MKSDQAKAEARKIGIAHPLFYDGLLATAPAFEKGYSTELKWKWLEENIKFAMAASDDITWFYDQRVNWWNGTVNDTLYQLLAHNKKAQVTNRLVKSGSIKASKLTTRVENINTRQGYYYLSDPKKPMETGEMAFNYQLNRNSRILSISFPDKIPVTLTIFINNILVKTLTPSANSEVVSLGKFKKGKLVILAKYPDKTEACSIDIYK